MFLRAEQKGRCAVHRKKSKNQHIFFICPFQSFSVSGLDPNEGGKPVERKRPAFFIPNGSPWVPVEGCIERKRDFFLRPILLLSIQGDTRGYYRFRHGFERCRIKPERIYLQGMFVTP
jgi:hypothetical protein